MAHGVTRSEIRKVKSIVSLIGKQNLSTLVNTDYQYIRGRHVYVTKTDDNELALSIWDEPKDEKTSHCLFADRISIAALMAAVDYWRLRYPATTQY